MLKNRRVIAIIFTLLFLLPIFGFGEEDTAAEFDAELDTEFDIEELRQRVLQEAPNELFSMSLFDNDVSLFFSGSWFGSFQLNPGFSFSPIGSGFMPPQTPVFSQEVDLTLSLWINNRWFVEANFNDGHAQNTYSAGYQGMPGEFIQFAVIGNTGLDFPSFPYMDLGGDSAASFGFYSRMGNQTWDIHTLLRYDSSAREERVFYGGRERNFFYEQPQNSIRGVSFVLPDYNIDSPIVVYIEDDRGTIIDNSFRRWRVASPSEFAASSSQGLVELSFRPQGMVAVSYSKNGDTRAWDISMGNYDGVPDGYLRTVQEWFGSGINLGDFPQAGNRNPAARRPGEVEFGTVPALVVFEPGTFSPFERRNRYQSPSSASEMSALVRLSSGSEISGFELIPFDSSFFTTDLLVFTAAAGQINIYELLKIGNFSRRDPQTLWPLAYDSPEIYLDVSNVFPGDIALRFTNFNAAGGFFIGTDIVPGSVQVWRSGIQDTNFSYSSFTGEVTLLGSVGQNELIRITFLRRSEETRLGSIAAGIGAIYQGAGPFSAQAAIGARMNVTSDTYSDEEHSSAGTLGLSAAADWDWDNLNFRVTGGMFFEQADQAGLFRIAGMEGHELLLPLPPQNAFISNPPISNPPSVNFTNLNPDNRSDLIFRNYINRTVLGNNLMPIEWNTPIIAGVNRPYPARDTQLGNAQVLALEFDFSGAENWSGFQVPISQFAPNLSGAGEIEIPFRFFGFNRELQPLDNFKVIIQIGALSGSDFAFVENQQLIWEKVLFDTDQDTFSNAGRIIRFTLDEDDRQKLSGARYIRLLAVYEGTETLTGRVLLASPIVRGAAFRPVISDGDAVIGTNIGVTAIETIDTHHPTLADAFPEIIRRVSSTPYTQRVLRVNWENLNTGFSAGVDSRLGNIPLADYRELAFFVKIPNGAFGNQNETLTFKIAAGPDNLDDYRLRANIPLDSLAARAGEWNKITIRYQGSNTGVFLNDGNVSVSDVFYRPNRGTGDNFSRNTNYTIILINPVNSVTALGDGTIYIDEIILEDPITFYRINAGAVLDYSRPGVLLSAGRTAILSDFTFFSAFESEIRSSMNTDDSIMFGSMAGRTGIDFSFLGTQISANLNSTIAQDTFLWSAEHEISRTFGSFSVRERFFASPGDNTTRHTLNLAYTSNFNMRFDADAFYDLTRLRQSWTFGFGYTPRNNFIPLFNVNTQANWVKNEQLEESENYAELWLNSWIPLIPDSGAGAVSRRTRSQFILTQRTRPVGASLSVEGNTFFSSPNNLTQTESSASLDIPIIVNLTNFNFRMARNFRTHFAFAAHDVFDDGEKLLESIESSFHLWRVMPFYSLFSDSLVIAMDNLLENAPSASLIQYISFNDLLETRIAFRQFSNMMSLFIPSRVNFRINRLVEQRYDTRTDSLNIGAGLGFNSVNMFGVLGYRPIFSFYQTDEFSHLINAAFVIPKGEDISWRVQSVLSAGFRGFTGGVLNFTNTFTVRGTPAAGTAGGFSNTLFWTESFTVSWETPTENSLLSVFYNWVGSRIEDRFNLFNLNYQQLRRETLEITIDRSTDYLRWSAAAGHEQIVRILGRLNLTAFIRLRMTEDKRSEMFTFDALLGTTLRVSF